MEPPENIGLVQGTREPDPKYLDQPLDSFIGNHVKLSFDTLDDRKEIMWVRVTSMAENEGEELRGILDNDPVLPMDVACGDIIEFSRSEVIDFLEAEKS